MTAKLRVVPATPPRAILYLRQSTYREESISLVLQETAARDYCDRMGYNVVAVEADPGVSGRTWKRPAVQRVMETVETGSADIIVLWRWSRLSRNRKDWAIAADRVDVAAGRIESATEPNDTTAAGRFGRGVMVELAAFESERIGEQWKEVHANRVARGLPSGRLPWGWRTASGGIEPHPDQAPAIPHLYEMYLAGAGGRELARWLTAHGYRTFYGRTEWNHAAITAALDSPIHSGRVIRHGELHPGAHEALVSAETWEKYRALRRARADERTARHTFLLSGLITCSTCNEPMYGLSNNSNRKASTPAYHAYRCKTVSAQRGHGPASVSSRIVEAAFMKWLRKYGDGPEPASDRTDDAQLRAERIAREIAAIDDEVLQLTLQLTSGTRIPQRAYDAAMEHHENRRATLAAELATIEDNLVLAPATPRADARRLLTAWEIIPVDGRRAAIRNLVAGMAIEHGNRTLTITPRAGHPTILPL